ncbi:MAG: hypothetical protein FK734_07420 [Asgard group archaeon]|nr:hypothetical protein [Asgard group archaeon]
MSVWRNKTNRTILIGSILLALSLAIIIFTSFYNIDDNPVQGLNWLFTQGVAFTLIILFFWVVYFCVLLIVGSIREKMNALPGWTEVWISILITLLPAIFIGNQSPNLDYDWVVFGGTFIGIILIPLWFIMSSTPRDEVKVSS